MKGQNGPFVTPGEVKPEMNTPPVLGGKTLIQNIKAAEARVRTPPNKQKQ